METLLAQIVGPAHLVLGLSMLLYATTWKKVIDGFNKDHLGLISLMITHLILGLVIVNTYNVWDKTWMVVVTITGWAMLIKGAAYFLLPGSVTKDMLKKLGSVSSIKAVGVIATVAGGGLSYVTYLV